MMAGLAAGIPARAAEIDQIPPVLMQNVTCMLDGLKSMKGFENPKFGYINRNGWYHPYVQYEYTEGSGWRLTIWFEAAKWERGTGEPERYLFETHLPGIRGPSEMKFDWGTTAVADRWHAKCAVDTVVTVG